MSTTITARLTTTDALAQGRRVLQMEREALDEAERRLDDRFVAAVECLARSGGRVVVSGVGKSGLIAHKIAATLTSTGTPALFLHPTDSLHGDLGVVDPQDVALLLSKSGETEELMPLLGELKRIGVPIVAITGNTSSTLARAADAVLDAWVKEEACPHDLAPTTSTTVQLALGDALAVALLQRKGFARDDFARLHPGGALGKKLLLRVRDVMESEPAAVLAPSATVQDAIVPLARRRGIVVIAEADQVIRGVFTAGDLTRVLGAGAEGLSRRLGDVMTAGGKRAAPEELASGVVYRMEQGKIVAMPVVDSAGLVVGVVHLHDLLRAGAA